MSAEQQDLLDAQAKALDEDVWGPSDDMYDNNIDIRTAVTALKAAIERPPVAPTNAAASHLRTTQSLEVKRREKYVSPEEAAAIALLKKEMARNGGSRMANGMASPLRAGGAVEDMAAGIESLQQRMGVQLASRVGSGGMGATSDPEGDACVSSLQSMLTAMQEMSVGAGSGALPPQQ